MYNPGLGAKDGPYYDAYPGWTGFYLGLNGGYGRGAGSTALTATATDSDPTTVPALSKYWTEGGFGGAQAGYNVQRDRMVFGVEADIQGGRITGSAHAEAINGAVTTDAWAKSNLDWFGTLRLKGGYAIGGSLVYATGGWAYGGVRDQLTQIVTTDDPATATNSASRNFTLGGFVAGAGVETEITPAWTVKAEYQYIDLGLSNLFASNSGIACTGGTCDGAAHAKFDHSYNTIRVGTNYRFNQPYEPLK